MGRLHKTRRFGPYSKEDKEAALRTLEEVEAVALRRRMLSELSSGQRQRVLIARALACDPEMMVLDEPTIGLDAAIEHSFYELLGRINERMTVLVVSHDLSFVSSYVRTVVCMDVNRTVHVHATSDLTDDMMAAVYGRNVRMIRHDHHDQCSHEEEDAQHGPEDRQ
jgi:zinc transport system ATP-binding protein